MSRHSRLYKWQNEDEQGWALEEEMMPGVGRWQTLYDYWKSQPNPLLSSETEIQALAGGQRPEMFFDIFRMSDTGRILVLPEYRDVVIHIADLYAHNCRSRVVITGQRGIGKSTLLHYLLAVLLSISDSDQPDGITKLYSAPVLLCTLGNEVLFYNGKAYLPRVLGVNGTPIPVSPNNLTLNLPPPAWVLVDTQHPRAESPGSSDQSMFFTVQAGSTPWAQSRRAIEFKLPLWDKATLLRGWKLHCHHKRLNRIIAWVKSSPSAAVLFNEEDLEDLVIVMSGALKKTLGVCKEEEELVCENHDKTLEALIAKATGIVGFAAGDVYSYLYKPKFTREQLRWSAHS